MGDKITSILVIDNNKDILDVFTNTKINNLEVSNHGYSEDVTNYIKEKAFDIIVIDIQDLALLEQLIESHPVKRIIAISDPQNIDNIRASIETGIKSFLFLPLDESKVDKLLNEMMAEIALDKDFKEQEAKLAQARKEISMSHIELNLIMSSISDGLYSFLVDDYGKIKQKYISPVVEELTGRPINELMGLDNFEKIIVETDRDSWREKIHDVVSGKEFQTEIEYRIITPDESVKWIRDSMRSNPLGIDEIQIDSVLSDITDRKKLESDLRMANATKDKFFSIIAHDLRNPFGVILGMSEYLDDDYEGFEPEQVREFIHDIRVSSEKMFKLLENLLDWARTQTKGIEINPEDISLALVAEENIYFLNGNAEKKNITLSSEVDEGAMAFADLQMITTVTRNLVSNAIKFTPDGGKITIKSKELEDSWEISICDNGVGISEENIRKLFRIDDQFKTSGTADEPGTGLGLILCKEFVEHNKGRIWVESEEGNGSEFKFTVPKEEK